VIAADARQLPLIDSFDRVLADVPCSGTGTLAHNPEIRWRLRPDDLQDLAARQFAILESAAARLARGGRLVYSTCSLEPEENEAVVERVLGKTNDFRLASCRDELVRLRDERELAWEDVDSLLGGEYLRTIPGVHSCDGFFAAVLERSQ
jgi:16S rRNA (cytosine967-C5)-methyltransferase